MVQQTVERERTNLPINSFVEVAERVPTEDEMAEMAELWVENPAARISSQLDELAVLYDGRIDRQTFYDFRGGNHQYDSFATRDEAENELEEIYTVHSQYSDEHGYTRDYSVTVVGGSEKNYRITVKDDELDIFIDSQGRYEKVSDAEVRDELVLDFFYRSLIATVRTTDRSFQQRQDADIDALVKLEYRMYNSRRKVVAATE